MDRKPIGAGTYGSVCKAMSRDGTQTFFAIKSMQKKPGTTSFARMKTELDIMAKLDHPNIIRLYEVFEDSQSVYIVMELCSGGELFDTIIKVGSFSEKQAAQIFQQMMSSLFYCHCQNVIHRDLKPENFIFQRPGHLDELKLIDFGLATFYEKGDMFKTKAGTPYYVAPQVLQGHYDEGCDVWSAGVILYIFMCGYPPFFGDKDSEILKKVSKGIFDFPSREWAKVSHHAKDLVTQCLTMEPRKRISAEKCLSHPWIIRTNDTSAAVSPDLASHVLNNLSNFNKASKFKKKAIHIMVTSCNLSTAQRSIKQLQEIRNVFKAIDTNGDGILTLTEMSEALTGKDNLKSSEFLKIFSGLDVDGNQSIEWSEFLAAAMETQKAEHERAMWHSFRQFDKNNDGVIDVKELKLVMADDIKDSAEAEQLVAEYDKDGDGQISFQEFVCMITGKQ